MLDNLYLVFLVISICPNDARGLKNRGRYKVSTEPNRVEKIKYLPSDCRGNSVIFF